MNVLCLGDCGIDEYLPQHQRRAGGIALNFALNARDCFQADDTVHIVAPLGTDSAADVVRERLINSGIATTFVTVPGNTPVQFIELDEDGERHFVRYEEGVLRDFRVDAGTAAQISLTDLLVTTVFEQNRAMFESVMHYAAGARCVAVDFADFAMHPDFALLDRHLGDIDIAFFGLRDTQVAIITSLAERAAASDTLLVVTLGAAGSRAYAGATCKVAPAVPVAAILDTTGAGDAFAAGFLAHYCRFGESAIALACGARRAATVISRIGAT